MCRKTEYNLNLTTHPHQFLQHTCISQGKKEQLNLSKTKDMPWYDDKFKEIKVMHFLMECLICSRNLISSAFVQIK